MEEEKQDFIDLLDDYLDNEEILTKKEIDSEKVIGDKKSKSSDSSFQKEDTIMIGKYVSHYLNINVDSSKFLHCDLKTLNSEYVMGIDNNYANKNPDLVHQGYLLLVVDVHNNRGTYINPFYIRKLLAQEQLDTNK